MQEGLRETFIYGEDPKVRLRACEYRETRLLPRDNERFVGDEEEGGDG
jgi:hypothetical protein